MGRLGIVTAAMLAAAAGGARAQPADPCALMTKDEFAELSGGSARSEPEPLPFATGSMCAYDSGQIVLFRGATGWEEMEQLLARHGIDGKRTPVPELGTGAYVVLHDPEAEYEDPSPILVFEAGPHVVWVSVYAKEDEPAETTLPETMAVGKAVAAKLQ